MNGKTVVDIGANMGAHTLNFAQMVGDAGTVYYNWPISQLTEIDRHILKEKTLTMVRVGIPHAILVGEQSRWCISARCMTIENMYWKDITKWMRDRSLLVERETNV